MLKNVLKVLFIIFCITGIAYLALPNFSFPNPPSDSIQSQEPADLETPLRRAYFSNYSRQEVLDWYGKQFDHSNFFGIKLPTFLFNYPPENAQTLIRDQTSSTFLQEFTHPFRESIYINGFQPSTSNGLPVLSVDGKGWQQKIIIRQVSSNVWIREVIFVFSAVMIVVIYNSFEKLFKK